MKKFLFSVLTLSSFACATYAQGDFYIRAGIGYAAPATAQNGPYGVPYNGHFSIVTDQSGVQHISSYEIKKAAFNTGVQGQLAFGYMFNKNIGVDLGLQTTLAYLKYESAYINNDGIYLENETTTRYASTPLIISPSLVLQTGGKELNVYARMGLALPLNTKLTVENTYERTTIGVAAPGTLASMDATLRCKAALGFTGAVGVNYPVGKKLRIYAEANGVSLTVNAQELEMTSYIYNGQIANVPTLPEDFRITRYSSTAENGKYPTYAVPFSNIGIAAGVYIML